MQAQVYTYISHLSLSDIGHTAPVKPKSVQELPLPAPHLTPQGKVD